MSKIPRDRGNDYTREMAEVRQRFLEEQSGARVHHGALLRRSLGL